MPVYVLLLIGAQSFSPIPTNLDTDDYDNGSGGGDNLSLVILSMISFSLEINAMNYTILSVLCGFSMFILANHKYFNVVRYNCSFTILFLGRDSIVGIVTCNGLDSPGNESLCRPGFLIEWHPVSARIIVARFKTTIRNIVMIQCYAPTAAAEEAEKQEFYVKLNEILRKQKKDIIILGGDLNAKVGQENEGLEHIMGRHGLGERNENGQLFVDFCARHDLVIGGTIFLHKDCHK